MSASPSSQTELVREMYDTWADVYEEFQIRSFPWLYIEQPAFDRYLTSDYLPELTDLYQPETRVLDIGCGSGVVVKHLVQRGVAPANITGIDVSEGLLERARQTVPDAAFIKMSADEIMLPPQSFDLITSNMVFHYLNNEQLQRVFDDVYELLVENGSFFFVMPDPDDEPITRDPANVNKWLDMPVPWGGTAPWFSRDPYELLLDYVYFAGFDLVGGGQLPVSWLGAFADPNRYQRYQSHPTRIAARLQRVSEKEKLRRLSYRANELEVAVQGGSDGGS